MRTIKILLLGLLLSPISGFAATYYVTQSGAGSSNGTSLSNAWSVSQFNSTTSTNDGDTVIFSGTITSTVAPADSAGSASNRIKLDFSGASLDSASPRIRIAGRSNLTLVGGKLGASSSGQLISFSNGYSNNITIDGFSYTGNANGTALFVALNYCTNLVIQNCTLDNVMGLIFGDSMSNGNVTIRNNYCRSSTNTSAQTDLIKIGDASNIVIEGNKLVMRAPGATVERHNDIVQCYQKGGSNAGNPSNWVIRYNWLELDIVGSSSGDTSWLQLEHMAGNPTCKIYSNVFLGNETGGGWSGNNGFGSSNQSSSSAFYVYNNTVIRKNGPDRTIGFITGGTLYARNNVGMADSAESGTFIDWAAMTEGGGSTGWDYNYWYQFDNASSNHAGTNGSTTTNPLFTNYAGNNFTLQSSSPLIGKGDPNIGAEYNQGIAPDATWPNPKLVTRSSKWDVGAYVFNGTSTTPSDTTAPVISGVSAVPAETAATVTWTTNEASSSRVEYGTTTSYGTVATDAAMVTAHTVKLSGLTAGTTYYYRVLSTDAAGNVATGASGTFKTTTAVQPGQLTAQPTSLSFGQVTVGSSANLSLTVKNTGGTSISGSASVAAPFSIVSGGSYTIAAGASQTVSVRYTPTAATTNSGSIALTGGNGLSVPVSGSGISGSTTPPPTTGTGTLEAESGSLSGPFTSSNGAISQSTETTDITASGRAAYTLNVAEAGQYAVVFSLSAPNTASNSVWFNIDAEPQDPTMIWDIPVTTSAFASRTGGWRGTGTPEQNQITPKYFDLTAGNHQLIIRGREAGVRIDKVSLVKQASTDKTAPVISAVSTAPAETAATVTWTTNEASSSRVEYGTTTSYGTVATDAAMVTAHTVQLSGLTAGTTYYYRVLSTDAAGNVATGASGTFKTTAQPGQLTAQPTSLSFGQVTVGSSANLSLTVKNTGGTSITGSASVAAPFSIVSGGSYTIAAGASQTVSVRYTPTAATTNSGSIAFTGGNGLSVPVSGSGISGSTTTPSSPTEAESGSLSGPFTSSNGAVSQSVETTDITASGRAAYTLNVPEAGQYAVVVSVAAPNTASNSVWFNIDAEPQDPTMIWDIPVTTSAFASRTGGWRGTGTPEQNQITPKYFDLTAGNHQLIIRGREAGVRIDKVSLVKRPSAPTLTAQ